MKVRDFTCFRDLAEDLVRGTVDTSVYLTVLTSAGPCRREDEYDVERKSDLATTKNTSHRTTVPIPNRCRGHLANQHNRNEHESSTIPSNIYPTSK